LMINGLSGYSFILKDWIYLFLLATVFTVLLYLMAIELSRKVSAFTFSLTFNLEPVYAIIIAMIIFNEARELNFSFYVGVFLVFLSVVLQNSTLRKPHQLTRK
ncbi:MAG: EamA family transporter, partial [Succinivibrio sp.]